MARKSKEETAISLFSFQDIITSVTGIMFLVVLLLMLMMITSRIPKFKDTQASESIKELRKEANILKNQLQQLRKNHEQQNKEIEQLKKLSPEEIQRKLEEFRQILQIEQAQAETLANTVQSKEERYKILLQEKQELTQSVEQKKKVIEDLQQQQKELTETIKQKEADSQQRNRVIKYVIHSSSVKTPVLAELDKDGIRFMDLNTKKLTDLRRPGNAHESLPMFAMELSRFNPSQVYFSVAVKPGGFKYALQVLKILKDNNIERGSEILPDDETSIFEDKKP